MTKKDTSNLKSNDETKPTKSEISQKSNTETPANTDTPANTNTNTNSNPTNEENENNNIKLRPTYRIGLYMDESKEDIKKMRIKSKDDWNESYNSIVKYASKHFENVAIGDTYVLIFFESNDNNTKIIENGHSLKEIIEFVAKQNPESNEIAMQIKVMFTFFNLFFFRVSFHFFLFALRNCALENNHIETQKK